MELWFRCLIFLSALSVAAGSAFAERPKVIDYSQARFLTSEASSYCQADFLKLARSRSGSLDNWISEANEAGTLLIGNCWWHSELQRVVFYRVVMKPGVKTKLSSRDALSLLRRLARQDGGVVEIPGFPTFRSFTSAFPKETLQAIDEAHFWANSLEELLRLPPLGAHANPDWIQKQMDAILNRLDANELPIINFTVEGTLVHHSYIVSHIQDLGSHLLVYAIDSNDTDGYRTFLYNKEKRQAFLGNQGRRMGINLMREEQYAKFVAARNQYCLSQLDQSKSK